MVWTVYSAHNPRNVGRNVGRYVVVMWWCGERTIQLHVAHPRPSVQPVDGAHLLHASTPLEKRYTIGKSEIFH